MNGEVSLLLKRRLPALRLAAAYALIAALWIWTSDRVLAWLVGDAAEQAFWQTVKGWLFVGITAFLLYLERAYLERTLHRGHTAMIARFEERSTELERSRAQLQIIMDNAPVIFYLRDLEGRYIMVNRVWEELTGLARDECIGKMPEELFPPEQAARLRAAHEEVVMRGGALTDESSILWRNQLMRFARARFVLTDKTGVPYAVAGLLTDITEFRRAEQAQRQAEARFRAVFENAGIGIALVDAQGRFLQTNAAYRRIVGYSERELAQMTVAQLGHPDDAAADWRVFQAMVAGEIDLYHSEKRFPRPDGTMSWMRVTTSRLDPDGEGGGLLLRLVEDITPSKEAELLQQRVQAELERLVAERTAELARANADLAEAQRVAEVGSWRLELPSNQLTLSAQTYAIIDQDPTGFEATPRGYLQIVHPDDRAAAAQAYHDIMAGVRPLDYEHRLLLRNGEVRVVNIRGYVRRDDAGKPIEAFGTLQDITRRRRLEDDLRRLNQELEARVAERTAHLEREIAERRRAEDAVRALNRALSEQADRLAEVNRELETFTYSVSHDLKAPLRGIDGYSRLLLEDYANRLDDDGLRFLQTIRQAATHMGTLIDDLLTYSRLERRQTTRVPVDLASLVNTLMEQVQGGQDGYKADIRLELECTTLMTDPDALSMILRNLLGNALKFSATVPAPAIVVRTERRNGNCLLSVRDNGIGFDMRYHDRIFEIFQRLHRAEEYPGTGVGLAIVRKAAQRLNGRVWAESAPGAGAVFFVELPQ